MAKSQIQSGFILINKPTGISSHTVVNRLRRITSIRKIGHAGTLDPLASGLMILAIGRDATRKIDHYVKLDKEYIATLHLGAETDTYDREGEVINIDQNLEINQLNIYSDRIIKVGNFIEAYDKFVSVHDTII